MSKCRSKDRRGGKKICGVHAGCVPSVTRVVDSALKCPFVTKVQLGFISSGLRSAKGRERIKVRDDGSCFFLSVRDNTLHQEVRLYVSDKDAAMQWLQNDIPNMGFDVSFMDRATG